MSLYLITGIAGAGKTEVCRALKKRGFEAHDIDDALARWQHVQTGYIHPKSSVKPYQRTAEFIREHSWIVPRGQVEELAGKAAAKPIFICGSFGNEDELRDLFAAVFILYVDKATIERRLATRTTGDWGKQPHELRQTLDAYDAAYRHYRERGDTFIDAAQPLESVVRAILAAAGANLPPEPGVGPPVAVA